MSTNTRVERLINVGISTEQIEKARNEFPQRQPDLDLNKVVTVQPSGQVLIPLSKVKYAINRVNEDLSWLDNFTDNNEYRQGEEGSFEVLLKSLEERGIDDFINSFQVDQSVPITASYYEDFDTYVIGEGKHRATFAKVIGMEKIMAEVTTYKSNPIEKQKFLDYQIKRKELEKNIQNINLEFSCEKAQIGLFKGERINIKYGHISIIKLEVFDSYYLDNEGKMDLNTKVMQEVTKFIKGINRLPIIRSFIANLTFNNKNYHTLTRLILERLVKHGYFKNK
ncbi:hypothetical protein FZD47_12860 [Bacillus infantis]|uniref:ParB/Sulfiredoxin domain-containing protein n=1 Tax=Bacillus infantis TaxID=324767 RepID=A0A5D4SMV8_9BACI|nr:hypothetical protein [Bacillus infantis]TYS64349.1 hypothetical protein FZD47_12860 [Bacillus infantis]